MVKDELPLCRVRSFINSINIWAQDIKTLGRLCFRPWATTTDDYTDLPSMGSFSLLYSDAYHESLVYELDSKLASKV